MINSLYHPWGSAAELARNSVYQDRGNVTPPGVLYVHYIAKSHAPFPVYRFNHTGPVANIQQAVQDAVDSIQRPGKQPEPVNASGGVTYERRSFAVFVMVPRQGRLDKSDGIRMWHDLSKKNHSFFNGEDLQDINGCSAMYCINFRKNTGGNDLGVGQEERFIWRTNHPHVHFLKGIFKTILALFYTHENSGTNLGP